MGYDSLSTWHQLGRPSAVHFDVGSCYTRPERARYEKLRTSFPQLLPVQDLSWLGANEESDAWVPLRNLLMTVHAAALGFNDIVMSAPADWASDKRLMFTLTTTLAMRVAQPGVGYRVRRPFSHWTKAKLIAATPAALLEEFAYSCYEGASLPCGRCSACGRATIAHLAAGREPPTPPPPGLSFREFTDLRRGSANGSRASQVARMHPGEWLYVPLRGWELLRAWNAYRKRQDSRWR
ncbi:MAG: 7-cyano-7-deazaguanine synthase [Deltaproteobacteria bacterium]|nr:7-cyano-7-deazaguanine synthase [Deltaproteobacteria bacterium]MBW2214812.1 7-cyano-7-deazaguanine synthase [Deltaproteobacteria bacterium]MBW2381850.1 7-cyano-7-deazaguanine synthase [Deltaproteobacteria bacterium]MBW2687683.1 7-cyano-7-deazaguanine synthase [Deltaproteobacteria bacterium]